MASTSISPQEEARRPPRRPSVNIPSAQDASRLSRPLASPVVSSGNTFDRGPRLHYTAFIRLPFPRGSFEDPPLVAWDAVKDKQLWKLISKASNARELNWEQIADNFGVGLNFLLMQAAWLYERHYEGMKKQMMRFGGGVASGTASPAPHGVDVGVGGSRLGSKDPPRPSSGLKINPQVGSADLPSAPPTPRNASLSRTPSTATVTQSRLLATNTPRQPVVGAFKTANSAQRRQTAIVRTEDNSAGGNERSFTHDGASESESGEEPFSTPRMQHYSRRMQVLGRKPMASMALSSTLGSDGDAEDGEDDSSGNLPFAAARTAKSDIAATIRGSPKRQVATLHQPTPTGGPKPRQKLPESSTSSLSSASIIAQNPAPIPSESESGTSISIISEPILTDPSSQQPRPGPLSPRHRAQIVALSPRNRRDGSDDSPSMGSSFSDLDDASVTQSALEEALLSNMRQGGSVVSRVGVFGKRQA
ncbi:Hypothetical protein R9X50_00427100 [Acrodontium crateriforme]|uniref:Autophagy-related protein 29 n=1 Tax=Acrodontium crateriforme TaxID=150365 RepID=A0AAQ3RAM0_9PEZI|nr:Hypothetical protein R9X50_00427100 [Acrodontium crateriforme]